MICSSLNLLFYILRLPFFLRETPALKWLSLRGQGQAHFQRAIGAVKLHLMLDHDGYLLCFAVITTGKTHASKVARQTVFQPGTIVVFDKGYADYAWWMQLSRQQVFFVTRLREDAKLEVEEARSISQVHQHRLAAVGQRRARIAPHSNLGDDADLDSIDCDAAPTRAEDESEIWMVTGPLGGAAQATSVRLPGFAALAGRTTWSGKPCHSVRL